MLATTAAGVGLKGLVQRRPGLAGWAPMLGLKPDYTPQTVNTDKWEATRQAWTAPINLHGRYEFSHGPDDVNIEERVQQIARSQAIPETVPTGKTF